MGTYFGLDIGTSQVKLLQAVKEAAGFKLVHFEVVDLNKDKPEESIKKILKQAKIKSGQEVNLALRESEVYTRIIETPKLSEAELASSIQFEAEEYIPVSLTDVDLSYQVISNPEEIVNKKTMQVLLIAVPKDRLKQLVDLMDRTDLIPKSLETELFALKRIFCNQKKSQVIVFFGRKTTDLMMLDNGVTRFLYSIPTGSLTLTRALARELALAEDQAEQYKRTYGLLEEQLEGKVAKALLPLVDEIIKEINKTFVYLQQQGQSRVPEQLILAGAGAMLPGLSGYLVKKLNLEVIIGDPFVNFNKDQDFKLKIPAEANPDLAVVTGLALKGLV